MDKMRFHAQIKSVNDEKREIEGWASTKDIDSMGDIVHPEGFLNLDEYMTNPVLTYQHDWHNPIGHVKSVSVKDEGLWVTGYIDSTEEKVWQKIKEGTLRALSIGYEPVVEEIQESEMGEPVANHIAALNLLEIAVVTLPANTECLFSVAKSLEGGTDLVDKAVARTSNTTGKDNTHTYTEEEEKEILTEILRLHDENNHLKKELKKYKDFALKQLKLS